MSLNSNMRAHFCFCEKFSTRCFLEGRTFVILCLWLQKCIWTGSYFPFSSQEQFKLTEIRIFQYIFSSCYTKSPILLWFSFESHSLTSIHSMFKSHGPVKHYLLATLKRLEIITKEINWFYIPPLKKKLSSSFWESHFSWIKQEAEETTCKLTCQELSLAKSSQAISGLKYCPAEWSCFLY